jgi:collagenase-like protein with putative collagen-binding domain
MTWVQRLFTSRHWWLLEPDTTNAVLTSGAGTYGQGDYAVAASTTDGSSILAYLPTSRTVTIATASLGPDSISGWWFRPGDGTRTYAGAYAGGSNVFTPPSSGDWVLVVDRKSLDLPPPGDQPMPTSVEESPPVRELKLAITPNPVRATGRIRFELPAGGAVRVTLLDVQGRERWRLVRGTYRAGPVELPLDAGELETGLYWCRVQAAGRDETRPLVVFR